MLQKKQMENLKNLIRRSRSGTGGAVSWRLKRALSEAPLLLAQWALFLWLFERDEHILAVIAERFL